MEDPINLFLEDMKDSDKVVLVDTMNKLTIVAAAIGPTRTANELVNHLSKLTSISNDEVLASLARQLYYVYDIAGGPQISPNALQAILEMLKVLCDEEEVVVRNFAIESLSRIITTIKLSDVESRVLPLFRWLYSGDWFAPRVSATMLIPALLQNTGEQSKTEILACLRSLVTDETPMARRAVALVLGDVALALANSPALKNQLHSISTKFQTDVYPLIQTLSIDEREHIRELVPSILVKIIPLIPAMDYYQLFLPLISGLLDDYSWRVRQALAKAFPDIMHSLVALAKQHTACNAAKLLQAGSPLELLGLLNTSFDMYCKLLTDARTEPRAHATLGLANVIRAMYGVPAKGTNAPRMTSQVTAEDSFEFSDLYTQPLSVTYQAKYAEGEPLPDFQFPKETIFPKLAPILPALAKDMSVILKQDLSDQLASVSHLVGRKIIAAHFVEVINVLTQDESTMVRSSVASNLEAYSLGLGASGVMAHIIPILFALSKDQRWRVRRAVVGNFSCMAYILGTKGRVFESRIIPILRVALSEHVHTVRNRACVELRAMTPLLGIEMIMERVFSMTSELFDEKINYLYRITALNVCLFIATSYDPKACSPELIKDNFVPVLLSASKDSVANVRILAAYCIGQICAKLDAAYNEKHIFPVLHALLEDSDQEVTIQAQIALNTLRKA